MVICPRCHAEYTPGIVRCSDCDVELVEALPADEPAGKYSTDALVTVFSSNDPGLVAIAQSMLQSAEIRFSVRGQLVPYPAALPTDLQVLAGDADDARRILAELTAPGTRP